MQNAQGCSFQAQKEIWVCVLLDAHSVIFKVSKDWSMTLWFPPFLEHTEMFIICKELRSQDLQSQHMYQQLPQVFASLLHTSRAVSGWYL